MQTLIATFIEEVRRLLPESEVVPADDRVVGIIREMAKDVSRKTDEATTNGPLAITNGPSRAKSFLGAIPVSLVVPNRAAEKVSLSRALKGRDTARLLSITEDILKVAPLEQCLNEIRKLPDRIADEDSLGRQKVAYLTQIIDKGTGDGKALTDPELYISFIDIFLARKNERFRGSMAAVLMKGLHIFEGHEEWGNISSDSIESIAVELCDQAMFRNTADCVQKKQDVISAHSGRKVNVYESVRGFIYEIEQQSEFVQQIRAVVETRNATDSKKKKKFVFLAKPQDSEVTKQLFFESSRNRDLYYYPFFCVKHKLFWFIMTLYNKKELIYQLASNFCENFDMDLAADIRAIVTDFKTFNVQRAKFFVTEKNMVHRCANALRVCIKKTIDFVISKDFGFSEDVVRQFGEVVLEEITVQEKFVNENIDSILAKVPWPHTLPNMFCSSSAQLVPSEK